MFDETRFRQVLGHFPTGVAVITAMGADGVPVGMAVGSFTSVSMDPPLVGFLPDKASRSWPKIAEAGSFCVNILAAEQETVCRAFAMRGGDKFADLDWKPGPTGSPVLEGVLAWIDCEIQAVHEAGDHWIVLGRVLDLDVVNPALPLVFFRGGYGRFRSLSLAAWEGDLASQLRSAELARPQMEAIAAELDVECVASAAVGDEMVLVASSGAARASELPTGIGQRIPFQPPLGTAFVAWAAPAAQEAWLSRLGKNAPAESVQALRAALVVIRRRGYSVGRGHMWQASADSARSRVGPEAPGEALAEMRALIAALPADYESPEAVLADDDVRAVSAPVFGPDGSVVLVLTVISATARSLTADLPRYADRLREAAAVVTSAMGGSYPPA